MFQIAIIVFRESLEIFLILGIVFAATKNLRNRYRAIGSGILIGIVGALFVSSCASTIAESYDGYGQELFNILLLSLTIFMIFVTIIWMRDRASKIKLDFKNLEQQRMHNLRAQASLALMVASLFFREGSEIVLFLTSILSVNHFSFYEILFALLSGISLGLASGCVLYLGIFKAAGRHIFKITSSLLILVASGLASEIANLISSADLMHIGSEIFWDSSWLLDDDSIIGRVLKIIIGYNARPTSLQMLFYFSTLFFLFVLNNIKSSKIQNKIETKI